MLKPFNRGYSFCNSDSTSKFIILLAIIRPNSRIYDAKLAPLGAIEFSPIFLSESEKKKMAYRYGGPHGLHGGLIHVLTQNESQVLLYGLGGRV